MKDTDSHSPISRDELEALVGEYRHLLQEHRRAGAESRVRRHLDTRLHELELRFAQLLDKRAPDEELRTAWQAHLHHGAPEPAQPAAKRPLVFRGRAQTNSVVEVRERADGDYDVVVDGHLVERVEGAGDFLGTAAACTFTLDGLVFREVFSVSEPALEALGEFVAEHEPHPPWRFAAELAADGLINRDFGLTPRGHRALAAARGR